MTAAALTLMPIWDVAYRSVEIGTIQDYVGDGAELLPLDIPIRNRAYWTIYDIQVFCAPVDIRGERGFQVDEIRIKYPPHPELAAGGRDTLSCRGILPRGDTPASGAMEIQIDYSLPVVAWLPEAIRRTRLARSNIVQSYRLVENASTGERTWVPVGSRAN